MIISLASFGGRKFEIADLGKGWGRVKMLMDSDVEEVKKQPKSADVVYGHPFFVFFFFFALQRLSCHHHLEISHSLTAGKKSQKVSQWWLKIQQIVV